MWKASRIVVTIALAGALAGCARFEPGREAEHGPRAVAGVLDLRAWNFDAEGAVRLSGEWDFASAALLDSAGAAARASWETRAVPDIWSRSQTGEGVRGADRYGTGAGTYRLRILLPRDAPQLAIRNLTGMNAFELDANGETVASAGKPSLDRATAVSAYRPGVAPVESAEGTLELLLRTSNYKYRTGGVWRALVLGDRAALAAEQRTAVYISIVLAVVVATLALNSLIIFAFRRKDRSYLLFAVFGFVIALRPLVTGEYALSQLFPGLSFEAVVRLEYATAFLGVPAAIAFFLAFFPVAHRRLWAMLLAFAPFVLFDFFLPLYWLTWSIFVFYGFAIAAMAVTTAAVLARAAFERIPGGRTMFVGGTLLGLCAVNDILYSSHLIQTGNLLPFVLAFFVLLQSLVLARRFTGAFDRAELLSGELASSNDMLKDEIQKAMATSARLEESLYEKEILLKEVHHRVKNSLQIVASIVSLQAHRSVDPAVAAISRSINERIRVISLANEKLYDVESGDKLDLVGYACDILRLAVSSYEAEGLRIETKVEGDRVDVESAIGIDFGLVLTELVANALKHALVPKGGGHIVVSIREGRSSVFFEVADDGPGFPADFDPAKTGSLGYRIVQALLRRREGSIEFSRGLGAVVVCSMKTS